MRKLIISFLAAIMALGSESAYAGDVTGNHLVNADFSAGPVTTTSVHTYHTDVGLSGVSSLQEVSGWNYAILNEATDTGSSGDGMAGAVMAYGSTNGFNMTTAPATGPDGNAGNCLAFVAVWTCGGYYYQNVTLPAGRYTISVPVYNSNGTEPYTSYIGFLAVDGREFVATVIPAVGQWTTMTVEFELTGQQEGTLALGYKAANNGSAVAPHLFFDSMSISYEEVNNVTFKDGEIAYRITSDELRTVSVCNYYDEEVPIGGGGGVNIDPKSVTRGTGVIQRMTVNYEGDIIIPSTATYNGVTYKVTGVDDGTFHSNRNITSVTFSPNLKFTGNAVFGYCSNLKSVVLPSGLETIGWSAFAECSSLESLTIPGSVTSIGHSAFYGCGSLKSLVLEDGTETLFLSGSNAAKAHLGSEYDKWYPQFNGCPIDSLYLGRNLAVLNDLDDLSPFPQLRKAVIGDNMTKIAACLFKYSSLSEIVIGNNVEEIGAGAFWISNLTSVTFPESVKKVDPNLFAFCNSLKSVSLPQGLENISIGMFICCEKLEELTVPASVKSIGYDAFFHCYGLKKLVLEDGADILVIDGYNQQLAGWGSYDVWQGAFTDCPLDTLCIGRNINKLNVDVTKSPFVGLKNVIISDSMTTLDNHLFNNCRGLESITFGANLKDLGAGTFFGCTGLTTLSIPEGITNLKGTVFAYCSGLKHIELPKSVGAIASDSFYGCTNIVSIKVAWDAPFAIGNDVFSGIYTKASLLVPSQTEAVYRNTDGWKNFTNLLTYELTEPGDINGDGAVDIGDIVMVISVMSGTETDATTVAAADVNNDGSADIGDIVGIIDFMRKGNHTDGTYFIRASDGRFWTRGEPYGSAVQLFDWGLPVVVSTTAGVTTLRFGDTWDWTIFDDDNTGLFADVQNHANNTWLLTPKGQGYILRNIVTAKYVSVDGNRVISVSNADDAAVFYLASAEEHRQSVTAYINNLAAKAAESTGLNATTPVELATAMQSATANAIVTGTVPTTTAEKYQGGQWDARTIWSDNVSITTPGLYKLTMQAFYRMTDQETTFKMHQAGTDYPPAYLFFGNTKIPVASVHSESNKVGINCWTGTDGKYYPNNQTSALAAFQDGHYVNTIWVYIAEPGDYTYGISYLGWTGDHAEWACYATESITLTHYTE